MRYGATHIQPGRRPRRVGDKELNDPAFRSHSATATVRHRCRAAAVVPGTRAHRLDERHQGPDRRSGWAAHREAV